MQVFNEQTGEWEEEDYGSADIPPSRIPPPIKFAGEEYNTPLAAGYGTRAAIMRPGQEGAVNDFGEPVSAGYVKDIENTVQMPDAQIKSKIASQIPGKPSDQQMSVFEKLQDFMGSVKPEIDKEARTKADDAKTRMARSIWGNMDASDIDLLLPKQKAEIDSKLESVYQQTYQHHFDKQTDQYKQFAEKQITAELNQAKEAPIGFSTDNRPVTKNAMTGALVYGDTQEPYKGGPLKPMTAINASTIPDLGNIGTSAPGVKNERALEGLKPEQANTVKMIADYKMQLPSGNVLRSPEWQAIIGRVSMYDSSFDANQYPKRQAVLKDFGVGNGARNIRSLNTAIAHLDTLASAFKELDNAPLQLWNKIANAGITAVGDPRTNKVNTAADAVAGELATVFKNTSGTDQEIKEWRKHVDTDLAPKQSGVTVDTVLELLGGRLGALKNQYEAGMGKQIDFTMLNPKSRKILEKLGFDISQFDPASAKETGGADTSLAGGHATLQQGGGKPKPTRSELEAEARRRGLL